MRIYEFLPIWVQNIACDIEGKRIQRTRYGKYFWESLKEYEERDTWSYDKICEYRDYRLQKMIQHCYNTVPYYRELFNEGGIAPEDIKRMEDLRKIPVLTKDIVNSRPNDFLSTAYPKKKMIKHHTSGTTGAGFVFMTTLEATNEQWAVWWRYRRRLGIRFDTLCANFGTRFVVPASQNKPPFWRYNKPCNQVYFSAFHENQENLQHYIDEIKRKRITWIHGYPSLLTELASAVLRNKDNTINNQIKYVTIGAENLLEYQKETMEKAFGVHVFQHYGMSEGIANFSEMPDKRIKVDEDYSAVEFVKEENDYTCILGTTLTNYAMPLLRWDTRDLAEVAETTDGRYIKSIDGRKEDYIVLPNGRKIGKLDHVFKDAIHLVEVQIKQCEDYSIKVLLVPRDEEYVVDINRAKNIFAETFGGQPVPITFETVHKIPKANGGKLRFIVSEVKKQ